MKRVLHSIAPAKAERIPLDKFTGAIRAAHEAGRLFDVRFDVAEDDGAVHSVTVMVDATEVPDDALFRTAVTALKKLCADISWL